MKYLTMALLLISAGLSIKHGWDAFRPAGAEQNKMMSELGISPGIVPYVGAASIIIGLLLLFPQTFFLGNLLNAMVIVTIMALSLHAGRPGIALMEIPFLALPLLLIWLKYPFRF